MDLIKKLATLIKKQQPSSSMLHILRCEELDGMCLLLSKKEKDKKRGFLVLKMLIWQLNRTGCLKNHSWMFWTQGRAGACGESRSWIQGEAIQNWQNSCIYLFNTHLLSTYCVPSMVFSAGSTAMTKMDKTPTLVELTFTFTGIIIKTIWDKNLLKQCPLRFSVVSFHKNNNNSGQKKIY